MARTAIHPGEHLAEELKALGMSAAALSRDINVLATGSLASSAVRVRSPPTPQSGSVTGSAAAQSFGSTCRSSTSCAGRMPTWAPLWKGCPRSGRSCARGARARTRMRLPTFNRRSSRAQPRKRTKPTIGPARKLDRAESTIEPSGQLERHDEHVGRFPAPLRIPTFDRMSSRWRKCSQSKGLA